MAEQRNSMTFEEALEGKHGEAVRELAEAAIRRAVDQLAAEFAYHLTGGPPFATGGAITPQRHAPGDCAGEFVMPRHR